MFYVAGTHAWVFYLLNRLPKKLDGIFSEAELGRAVIFCPNNRAGGMRISSWEDGIVFFCSNNSRFFCSTNRASF